MSNFVTDPSSVPSGLSDAVNVDLSRNGTIPMPGEQQSPPREQEPQQSPPAPSFADIEGFASGAELAAAASDPAQLQQFIKDRIGRLNQGFAQEREQAEHFRNLMGVPEMREHIMAKLEGRQDPSQQRRQPQPNDEIAQLRAELRQLKGEYQAQTKGQAAVQEFASTHPDLPTFAPAMQRIIQENPGTTLAVAYRLAKFEAGALANTRKSSTPPVSERPTAGMGPTSQNDVVAALSAQARDRGRFRTMEDAFAHVARQTGAYQE